MMKMPDIEHELKHWLFVHERVRKQAQRAVILLALIAASAIIQGYNRLQSNNEGYQIAREFTLQIKAEDYREEMIRFFQSRCRNAHSGCKEDRLLVRLEEIPHVGWEYERFLKRNLPQGFFEFEGYKLGYASLGLLFLLAPLGLLVVIYLRIRTTAKIAGMHRELAVDSSEVQQRFNSVFSERATRRLGENRRFYATVWVTVIIALSLTSPYVFVAMQTMNKINTEVAVDNQGNISPLPDVSLDKQTTTVPVDRVMLGLTMVISLVIISIGWLTWTAVVKQLTPLPEPRETNDQKAP
jgi:hypothetical protein